MQDNDLNIEDFKEIFLKSIFANDDLNPTATTEEIALYFELESNKFRKKNSDDSFSQKLKDLVFKKFINWIEKAKMEVSEPFIEYEQRRLFNIMQAQAQGNDVSGIDKPSRYNLSIPISNVSKRLGGRLELWVVEYIYEGFKLFKQQHEEDSNVVTPPATEQPINTKEFDNTTLTQIMNDDMIDLFLKNEQRLKADGYITSENKWIKGNSKQPKSRIDLANLILLLKEKKYLKSEYKIGVKKKRWKDMDYKKFFEVRYGCNLKEQFGDAIKDRTNRLETSKGAFIYF